MSSFVVPEEISMIVSSDPNSGATNISSDGSYFEVQLQDGLKIPKDALNVNIAVEEATVWWVVPNIITGQNDKLYITGPDTSDVVQNYVITIPQGLYDLAGLNQAVLRELENAGAKIDPDPLITLTPDEPTQKVEIRFNYPTVEVNFTPTSFETSSIVFPSLKYFNIKLLSSSVKGLFLLTVCLVNFKLFIAPQIFFVEYFELNNSLLICSAVY